VYPILPCPAQVSFAGCVLPSSPSPCSRLSLPPSTMLDKTPQWHTAGFPFLQYSSACLPWAPHQRLGSGLIPYPGFPLCVSISVYPTFDATSMQEPMGPPKFFGVSLPACHGLWTPADLHIQATMDDLVLPSVIVKTLGIRNKLISKLYQHFRVRGHPCGLQDSLSTLRPCLVRS